jgi:hypothetical protein
VLRYATFVSIVPALWFTTLQTQSCQLTVSLAEIGIVLVVASSGIIFANRVIAVWGASAKIAVLIGVLYLAMTAIWVNMLTQELPA